ncbi:MAG: YfhO family protein [Chloroflexi bacterium]|nr:YfhO family protein [Chloroflexota bacterium]
MRWIRRWEGWALAFLILVPFVLFWQVTLGQGVWFGNDIVRTYYPLGVELSRALNAGRIPLWSPGLYGGFPILADAQIGALYPLNLILFRFLPSHLAVSYSMLLHLAWAAVGMYLLMRSFGLRISSALLAGLVFSLNGFMLARLEHATVLTTSAWLPWIVFLQHNFQRAWLQKDSKARIWFFLLTLSIGMQLLCGFPQIAFMSLLTVGLVGLVGRWWWNNNDSKSSPQDRLSLAKSIVLAAFWIALPIFLGAAMVAAQLLPTAELVGYSVRGSTLDAKFLTSYSLPPEAVSQFIFPFLRGEPAESQNNEYWAYLGLVPFALAILAPFLRRDKRTFFFAIFALVALSLTLGTVNSLYNLLYQLPGFNLFRVPARYLLLFVFAVAILAAVAFDELSNRLKNLPGSMARALLVSVVLGLSTIASIWLAQTQPIEFWLRAWQILPFIFTVIAAGLLFALRANRVKALTFQALIVGVTLFDLASAAPVFTLTLGLITNPANVAVVPRSLAAMDLAPGDGRIYTNDGIMPSPPAIRASLFPNLALVYGKESTQAYSSLALTRQSDYFFNPSPVMFNIANTRYFAVPLEPRPQTKSLAPNSRLAIDVINNEEIFPATLAAGITVTSFTEHAEELADGTPIGELVIRRHDARVESFPMRAGIETGDWDWARKNIRYSQIRIARTFSGFWRSFGRNFQGNTYSAHFAFDPSEIVGINIRTFDPAVGLTIERVILTDPQGKEISLAKLIGKNGFAVTFLSDTAAIWQNLDVLPRAFIVHAAEIANDDRAYERMREPAFPTNRLILLNDGKPMQEDGDPSAQDNVLILRYEPERVELIAETNRAGYLFLADSWYPGWNAYVDGNLTPIQRANVLFRAVPIEPGKHQVVFEYRPQSFVIGATISIISVLILVGICILYFR